MDTIEAKKSNIWRYRISIMDKSAYEYDNGDSG